MNKNEKFRSLQDKLGFNNKRCAEIIGTSVRTIERYRSGDRVPHQSIINLLNLEIKNKALEAIVANKSDYQKNQ